MSNASGEARKATPWSRQKGFLERMAETKGASLEEKRHFVLVCQKGSPH